MILSFLGENKGFLIDNLWEGDEVDEVAEGGDGEGEGRGGSLAEEEVPTVSLAGIGKLLGQKGSMLIPSVYCLQGVEVSVGERGGWSWLD